MLRSALESDAEFGREVISRVAHMPGHGSTFAAQLSESDLAWLYVWIERHFPPAPPRQLGVMSETTTTTAIKNGKLVNRALRDLTGVGRSWAAYGLTVSKSALETSASTLRKTADWLASLSAKVNPTEPPAAAKDEPKPETTSAQ